MSLSSSASFISPVSLFLMIILIRTHLLNAITVKFMTKNILMMECVGFNNKYWEQRTRRLIRQLRFKMRPLKRP